MDGYELFKEMHDEIVELTEIKERLKATLKEYEGAVSNLLKAIDEEQISTAKSRYFDRGDVEKVSLCAKDICKIFDVDYRICPKAEEILQKKENKDAEEDS